MKNTILNKLWILVIIYFPLLCHAQTNPSPSVSIANWQGNKKAGLCITLDDGCINQFKLGQPIMDSLNLNGTFYIIANLPSNCDGGYDNGTAYYTGADSTAYW